MKTVVITGATGGLGRVLTESFALEKCSLGLGYFSNKDLAERLKNKIEAIGSRAFCGKVDIRSAQSVKEFFADAEESLGAPDVFINNAAAICDRSFLNMTEEQWDDVIEADLKSIFLCCREEIACLEKNGGGHIINIGSMSGIVGRFGQANYAAAKAGIIGLTKTIAKEHGGANIKANVIVPGFMETPMTEVLPEKIIEINIKRSCLGRLTFPQDVAKMAVALASTESVSGQIIICDSRINDFTLDQ